MIEKTEFGWTGSITDLPLEVRGNPDAAMATAFAMTVGKELTEREADQRAMGLEGIKPPMPTCEVCKQRVAVGVCCVPGVPYSAAYCQECLGANAHPYFIVVANTACCGGLDQTHQGWQDIVRCTLVHLGKSLDEFNADVAEALKKEEELGKID